MKKTITLEEERMLIQKAKENDKDAKQVLLDYALEDIYEIADEFTTSGISYEDLVSEGVVAFYSALKSYTFAYDFKNYYKKNIKEKLVILTEKLNSKFTIKQKDAILIFEIKKFINSYEKKYNKKPSVNEIMEKVNVSYETIEKLNKIIILNAPSSKNNARAYVIDEEIEKREQLNKLYYLLDNSELTEEEKEIIKRTSGLNGKKEKLSHIAMEKGVSYDSLYRKKSKAVLKMKKKEKEDKFYVDEKKQTAKELKIKRQQEIERCLNKEVILEVLRNYFPTESDKNITDQDNAIKFVETYTDKLSKHFTPFEIIFLYLFLNDVMAPSNICSLFCMKNAIGSSILKKYKQYTKHISMEINDVKKQLNSYEKEEKIVFKENINSSFEYMFHMSMMELVRSGKSKINKEVYKEYLDLINNKIYSDFNAVDLMIFNLKYNKIMTDEEIGDTLKKNINNTLKKYDMFLKKKIEELSYKQYIFIEGPIVERKTLNKNLVKREIN